MGLRIPTMLLVSSNLLLSIYCEKSLVLTVAAFTLDVWAKCSDFPDLKAKKPSFELLSVDKDEGLSLVIEATSMTIGAVNGTSFPN